MNTYKGSWSRITRTWLPVSSRSTRRIRRWVSFPFPYRIHKVLTIAWTGAFVLDNPAPTASPLPFLFILVCSPKPERLTPRQERVRPTSVSVFIKTWHTHTYIHVRARQLSHQAQMRAFSKSKKNSINIQGVITSSSLLYPAVKQTPPKRKRQAANYAKYLENAHQTWRITHVLWLGKRKKKPLPQPR